MDDLSWLDDIKEESTETIDSKAIEYAESLLDNAMIEDNMRLHFQYEINDCLFTYELYEVIGRIKDALPDRIDGGLNYNQTDIKNKLTNLMNNADDI